MHLLVLLACSQSSVEVGDFMPYDNYVTDERTVPSSDSSHSSYDDHPASTNPPCSFRTDVRKGNGRVVLTMEVDQPGLYALQPASSLTVEDSYNRQDTDVVGYNLEGNAEVFPGEKGVVYSCFEGFWYYLGETDLTYVMDHHTSGITQLSARRYNEDDSLNRTDKVEFHARVIGLTLYQ